MMSDKVTKDPENKKEQKGQKDFRHGHRDRYSGLPVPAVGGHPHTGRDGDAGYFI